VAADFLTLEKNHLIINASGNQATEYEMIIKFQILDILLGY
jgi:hypothetical protein